MTETTAPDLRALRELAEAATPGPWVTILGVGASTVNVDPALPREQKWKYGHLGYVATAGSKGHLADAAFIAAANPKEVLALLDRLEAAEAVVNRVHAWRADARTRVRMGISCDCHQEIIAALHGTD